MKVTAVIPCYNGEKHIAKAIEHILDQTRPADEVIVIDDGSTDDSLKFIERFGGITIIKHETNKGLPTGRNNAWKAARGDIMIYVDVDAYCDRQFIENIVKEYSSEHIGAVGGAGYEVYEDTAPNRWRKLFLSQNHGPDRREDVKFLFGIGASFRKDVLAELGGFDPLFRTNGEDVEICLRLRKKGYTLVYTPDAKVFHHRRDTLVSLLKMIYRWWLWGHLAHIRNGVPYFKEHILETLTMTRYTIKRSIRPLSFKMLGISLLVMIISLSTILKAELLGRNLLKEREKR